MRVLVSLTDINMVQYNKTHTVHDINNNIETTTPKQFRNYNSNNIEKTT